MRRISVSTALFDGYPLEQAFDEIAAAGASYVEPAFIHGYVEFTEAIFTNATGARLSERMRAAGLSVLAVSAHMDLGLPGAVDMLRRRLDLAGVIGAGILITNATNHAAEATFRRNLDGIIAACERAAITLALENPGHGTDSLVTDAGTGAKLVDEIGSPRVRLNYDFGNIYTCNGGRQPALDFPKAATRTVHAHLKDIRDTTGGGWEFCALGEGLVDYTAVGAALASLAHDVPLGLELPLRLRRRQRGDPERCPSPRPLTELRRALTRSLVFVRAMLARQRHEGA
jgi:sugar phosphate isomerase/epimerase